MCQAIAGPDYSYATYQVANNYGTLVGGATEGLIPPDLSDYARNYLKMFVNI